MENGIIRIPRKNKTEFCKGQLILDLNEEIQTINIIPLKEHIEDFDEFSFTQKLAWK